MKINEKHAKETSTYSQTIDKMRTEIKVKKKKTRFHYNIIITDDISAAKIIRLSY